MTAAVVIFASAVCLSATMAGAWLVALQTGRSGWIDAIWSFATGVFGATFALIPLADGELSWRQMLVAALALAQVSAVALPRAESLVSRSAREFFSSSIAALRLALKRTTSPAAAWRASHVAASA